MIIKYNTIIIILLIHYNIVILKKTRIYVQNGINRGMGIYYTRTDYVIQELIIYDA